MTDDDGAPMQGLYTAGWIKRGPSGVIGTNKACAVETMALLLEDLAADRLLHPADPAAPSVEALVRSRQPLVFDFDDWKKLDEIEMRKGEETGRPRVKFTTVREMADAIGR